MRLQVVVAVGLTSILAWAGSVTTAAGSGAEPGNPGRDVPAAGVRSESGEAGSVVPAAGSGAGPGDSGQADWGYRGEVGPAHWAELDPAYAPCGDGREQSPIDLVGAERARLAPLGHRFGPTDVTLVNTGHTIQGRLDGGTNVMIVGGERYTLRQFHFHAPSEHRIGGDGFPLEGHFVHESDAGAVAVVGVLFTPGEHHPTYGRLFADPPASAGEATAIGNVDLGALLPDAPAEAPRFAYAGSLTTPPCTEGVAWTIFAEPIELSDDQIQEFRDIYSGNNRPLQPLGDRVLTRNF